jgi:hypothetical protein
MYRELLIEMESSAYLSRRMSLSSELGAGVDTGTVMCMVEHGADVGLRSRSPALTAA